MKRRRSIEAEARIENVKRLLACLAGGFVLALMVGTQEGTQQDFGYAFREAVFAPRIVLFLGIGVLLYLAITFGPRARPYLTRPGLRPLGAGAVTVLVSFTLLKWTDNHGHRHRQVPPAGEGRCRHGRAGLAGPRLLRLAGPADGVGAVPPRHRDGRGRDAAPQRRPRVRRRRPGVRPRHLGDVLPVGREQLSRNAQPRPRRRRRHARVLHDRRLRGGLGSELVRGRGLQRLRRPGDGLAPRDAARRPRCRRRPGGHLLRHLVLPAGPQRHPLGDGHAVPG